MLSPEIVECLIAHSSCIAARLSFSQVRKHVKEYIDGGWTQLIVPGKMQAVYTRCNPPNACKLHCESIEEVTPRWPVVETEHGRPHSNGGNQRMSMVSSASWWHPFRWNTIVVVDGQADLRSPTTLPVGALSDLQALPLAVVDLSDTEAIMASLAIGDPIKVDCSAFVREQLETLNLDALAKLDVQHTRTPVAGRSF